MFKGESDTGLEYWLSIYIHFMADRIAYADELFALKSRLFESYPDLPDSIRCIKDRLLEKCALQIVIVCRITDQRGLGVV